MTGGVPRKEKRFLAFGSASNGDRYLVLRPGFIGDFYKQRGRELKDEQVKGMHF